MTTSQAIVYTFAWSICLLHHHVASATEALSKVPMYDCGSAQPGQPLIQHYSLNTPDHYSNLSTTPWPYNLINYTPSWVRATFTFIFIIIVFARPAYSLLLCIQWCAHAVTLRAPLRSNRDHLQLAGRLDAATGVGEPGGTPHLAMAPVIQESRLQAQVWTLQLKVARLETIIEDNYQSLKKLQDIHTRVLSQSLTVVEQASDTRILALEQASDIRILALEEALRKQAIVINYLRSDRPSWSQPSP